MVKSLLVVDPSQSFLENTKSFTQDCIDSDITPYKTDSHTKTAEKDWSACILVCS